MTHQRYVVIPPSVTSVLDLPTVESSEHTSLFWGPVTHDGLQLLEIHRTANPNVFKSPLRPWLELEYRWVAVEDFDDSKQSFNQWRACKTLTYQNLEKNNF